MRINSASIIGRRPSPFAGKTDRFTVFQAARDDCLDVREAARLLRRNGVQEPDTRWLFHAEGWMYEPAVGRDGTVYVGCGDKNLYAFTPEGQVKWKAAVGFNMQAPAEGPDGTLYVGNDQGQMVAVSAAGKVKWRFDAGYGTIGAAAVGADGHSVYFGSADNHVWKIYDRGDQAELAWKAPVRGGVEARPLVTADGWAYVGDLFGDFHAWDADGHSRWHLETHEPFRASAALGQDGSILMTRWKSLEAYDAHDGQQQWNVEAKPGRESGPTVAADGTIYVAGYDGKLQAYGPLGTPRWNSDVHAALVTTPLQAADGTVVVRDWKRRVWAVAPGQVLWSAETADACHGGSIMTAPAVAADGTVYVGNNDSTLTALHFRTFDERIADARQQSEEVHRIQAGDEWIIIDGVKIPVHRKQS